MNSNNAITNRVIKCIEDLSSKPDISVNDNISDLNLDSMSLVSLLVKLEEDFLIEFTESDLDPYDLKTVNSICALVRKYIGECDG